MIPYSTWIGLPLSTRMKVAAAMNIPKLRSTHVANDQVLDDGYNLKDVEEAIKVIPMQNYLNSTETDVFKLFQQLIDTVEGRVELAPIASAITVEAVPEKVIKKRGRPFKKK